MFDSGLLSNDKILEMNYEPQTIIFDYSRIDLDQKEIEDDLAEKRFQSALNIYKEGAYSGAYATLTLASQAIMGSVTKGTPVTAIAVDGENQEGIFQETVALTATSIQVQYETSIGCANVRDNDDTQSDISRCFSETGQIAFDSDIGTNVVKYNYDIKEDTKYSRSLKRLRTNAELNMPTSSQHDHYRKFFNYYGQSDYANQWIISAFKSINTNFDHGNANFRFYHEEGRIEAITKGTRSMSVLMHVIDEMEGAIYDCFSRCTFLGCSSNQGISSWDKAVAFYVGSQEDGNGGGYMPYALANEECKNFGTCDSSAIAKQQAKANLEIMEQFNIGKDNLMLGNCYEAKQSKDRIIQLTTIPLVQGTLRRAYHDASTKNYEDNNTKRIKTNGAEGAVFAASILPLIHACNKKDADTIHRNMKGSAEDGLIPSYAEVKMAFENNYECLGITCEEVGGLVDVNTDEQYFYNAQPCGIVKIGDNTIDVSTSNVYRITPFTSALVILIVVTIILMICTIRRKRKEADIDTMDQNDLKSSITEDSVTVPPHIDNSLESIDVTKGGHTCFEI